MNVEGKQGIRGLNLGITFAQVLQNPVLRSQIQSCECYTFAALITAT